MGKNIPTAHISVTDENLIAKTVIMPGDPLRAKMIAEKFLDGAVLVNEVRNMYAYTGTYKGKKVTVMGSGMGMPSIGIYSYELYAFYGVENIIRVGSAGAYIPELDLFDIVIAEAAFGESNFAEIVTGEKVNTLPASKELNDKLEASAKALNYDYKLSTIHSSDVFYRKNFDDYKTFASEFDCSCVEMESFALFANAKELGKNAACILTISDSLVKHQATSAEERQNSLTRMIEVALESVEG